MSEEIQKIWAKLEEFRTFMISVSRELADLQKRVDLLEQISTEISGAE